VLSWRIIPSSSQRPRIKAASRPASLIYSALIAPQSTRRAVYNRVVAMNEQDAAVASVGPCVHGLV
jgi:hypothetical protein